MRGMVLLAAGLTSGCVIRTTVTEWEEGGWDSGAPGYGADGGDGDLVLNGSIDTDASGAVPDESGDEGFVGMNGAVCEVSCGDASVGADSDPYRWGQERVVDARGGRMLVVGDGKAWTNRSRGEPLAARGVTEARWTVAPREAVVATGAGADCELSLTDDDRVTPLGLPCGSSWDVDHGRVVVATGSAILWKDLDGGGEGRFDVAASLVAAHGDAVVYSDGHDLGVLDRDGVEQWRLGAPWPITHLTTTSDAVVVVLAEDGDRDRLEVRDALDGHARGQQVLPGRARGVRGGGRSLFVDRRGMVDVFEVRSAP